MIRQSGLLAVHGLRAPPRFLEANNGLLERNPHGDYNVSPPPMAGVVKDPGRSRDGRQPCMRVPPHEGKRSVTKTDFRSITTEKDLTMKLALAAMLLISCAFGQARLYDYDRYDAQRERIEARRERLDAQREARQHSLGAQRGAREARLDAERDREQAARERAEIRRNEMAETRRQADEERRDARQAAREAAREMRERLRW